MRISLLAVLASFLPLMRFFPFWKFVNSVPFVECLFLIFPGLLGSTQSLSSLRFYVSNSPYVFSDYPMISPRRFSRFHYSETASFILFSFVFFAAKSWDMPPFQKLECVAGLRTEPDFTYLSCFSGVQPTLIPFFLIQIINLSPYIPIHLPP